MKISFFFILIFWIEAFGRKIRKINHILSQNFLRHLTFSFSDLAVYPIGSIIPKNSEIYSKLKDIAKKDGLDSFFDLKEIHSIRNNFKTDYSYCTTVEGNDLVKFQTTQKFHVQNIYIDSQTKQMKKIRDTFCQIEGCAKIEKGVYHIFHLNKLFDCADDK